MKGTYYKTPIDFKALIEKRDLAKTTLETSIDQQLFLLATTAWGECKFGEAHKWNLYPLLRKDSFILKEGNRSNIRIYGGDTKW